MRLAALQTMCQCRRLSKIRTLPRPWLGDWEFRLRSTNIRRLTCINESQKRSPDVGRCRDIPGKTGFATKKCSILSHAAYRDLIYVVPGRLSEVRGLRGAMQVSMANLKIGAESDT